MRDPLRSRTIRLAYQRPELRPHLLPLLQRGARSAADWSWITWNIPGKHVFDEAKVYTDASVVMNGKARGRATVTDAATVTQEATVEGRCTIKDKAVIRGNATVKGWATVGGEAYVEGDAEVGGRAVIKGNALVKGNAVIKGKAIIYGGTWDGSEGPITSGTWSAPGVPADPKNPPPAPRWISMGRNR